MARIVTVGFAIASSGTSLGRIDLDYGTADATNVTNQTGVKRSGDTSALQIANSTGVAKTFWQSAAAPADVRFYARFYYRISATPSNNSDFFRFLDSSNATLVKLTINTSAQLILKNTAGTQIGSPSSALSADTWYMVELMMMNGSTASTDELELRIDGVSVASTTTDDSSSSAPIGVQFASTSATQIGVTQYFASFAVNDDSGASETSWPGAANCVLCNPASDNQAGSWTGGSGGTTNLYDAVNNTPPVGTATETDTSQIESADTSGDNSTDEYRANLTTYETAGVATTGKTVSVVHPIINHGEDSAPATKTGSFGMQANPSAAYTTFTFGDDVGALGTWPTNWRWTFGTPLYSPTVTITSAPVIAVRKTDAAALVASVAFVGAYVEYIDSPLALDTADPDADVTTTGWTSTPLWSKVNDASDASYITATAS